MTMMLRFGAGPRHIFDLASSQMRRGGMLQSIRGFREPLGHPQNFDALKLQNLLEQAAAEKLPLNISDVLQGMYRSVDSEETRATFLMEVNKALGLPAHRTFDAPRSPLQWDEAECWRIRGHLHCLYETWFEQSVTLDEGLQTLVRMRADLLKLSKKHGELQYMLWCLTACLRKNMSKAWLQFHVLTADEPPEVLQLLQSSDVVHPMSSSQALLQRLPPTPHRRCFALIHPLAPAYPLVWISVALMPQIPSSMTSIQEDTNADEMRSCAIFYSINSTHDGLAGIQMGNVLITHAADHLKTVEGISHFCTLSPLPGLSRWLAKQAHDCKVSKWSTVLSEPVMHAIAEACKISELPVQSNPLASVYTVLTSTDWVSNPVLCRLLETPILSIALVYLNCDGTQRKVQDPVANFHLGNGAAVWRLNYLADTKPQRLHESFGLMVNYFYDLDSLAQRSAQYKEVAVVATGDPLRDQLMALGLSKKAKL